jgi:hypothetical protein
VSAPDRSDSSAPKPSAERERDTTSSIAGQSRSPVTGSEPGLGKTASEEDSGAGDADQPGAPVAADPGE